MRTILNAAILAPFGGILLATDGVGRLELQRTTVSQCHYPDKRHVPRVAVRQDQVLSQRV